jgi:V/A-type H+-transporting ATPase subunit C
MPDRFESAYAYARVCGSLARSYLGEKAGSLAGCARVGEAWRAVFTEAPPTLPESELADAAEKRLRSMPIESLRRIAGSVLDEEPFFAALLRKAEFAHLKKLLSAIVEGAPEPPSRDDPSAAPEYAEEGYPELDAMFRRTRYQWLIEKGLEDLPMVKNALDRQYYAELWKALETVGSARAGSLRDLIRLEAELENLVWGLRLKRYYSMGAEEIEPLLIALDGVDISQPTLDALKRRADSRAEWASWKWERLVPDSRREDGGDWFFDLRGFENAAHRHLFRRLYLRLHMEPDSYVPLYAYFRIKEFESEAIQGIIEGIKLEAPANEIASFALDATGGPG